MLCSEEDKNEFLTELRDKEVVDKSKTELLALQNYVAQPLKNATKGKYQGKKYKILSRQSSTGI